MNNLFISIPTQKVIFSIEQLRFRLQAEMHLGMKMCIRIPKIVWWRSLHSPLSPAQ